MLDGFGVRSWVGWGGRCRGGVFAAGKGVRFVVVVGLRGAWVAVCGGKVVGWRVGVGFVLGSLAW